MNKTDFFRGIESKFYTQEHLGLAKEFADLIKNEHPHPFKHGFEIGCGFGIALRFLDDLVDTLTLSDIDESALQFIDWKYNKRYKLQRDNVIPEDADIIFFFMSLHHIEHYKNLIDECINHIVANDGMIAICEFEPNPQHVFHLNEKLIHDGLYKTDFDWLTSDYRINTKTFDIYPIICRKHKYSTYVKLIQK